MTSIKLAMGLAPALKLLAALVVAGCTAGGGSASFAAGDDSPSWAADHAAWSEASDGHDDVDWAADQRLLALALGLQPRCTLARRLTLAGGPHPEAAAVLVAPPAAAWPAGLAGWRNRTEFLRRHGRLRVSPRTGVATAQGGAHHSRGAAGAAVARTVELAEIVAGWRDGGTMPAASRLVFEPSGGARPGAAAAGWRSPAMDTDLGGLRMPDELGGGLGAGSTSWELVLSAGPAGAGLPRHTHGRGWLALAAGLKWWVLHAPGDTTAAADPRSPAQWLVALAEAAAAGRPPPPGVEWCLQQPAEVLLLPEYTHHATVNLRESVAVAGQANALGWDSPAAAAKGLRRQLKRDPTNPRLREALGQVLSHRR
jgi:hypothetical protein